MGRFFGVTPTGRVRYEVRLSPSRLLMTTGLISASVAIFLSTTRAVSFPIEEMIVADFPSEVKSTKFRISSGPTLIQDFQGDFTSSRIRISVPPSGVFV